MGHPVPGWGAGASPCRSGAGGQQGCSQCLWVQLALGHGLCRDALLQSRDDMGRDVVPFFNGFASSFFPALSVLVCLCVWFI